MQYTEHLALKKPEPSDYVNINDLNGNVERIDEEMHGKADRQLSNLDTPQTALYHLGAGVRPNLLTNAYFANPVNQRGQTTYSGVGMDCIDMWYRGYSDDATLTIQDGYIEMVGAENAELLQRLNALYLGEELTASVLLQDGTLFSATATMPTEYTGGYINTDLFYNIPNTNGAQINLSYYENRLRFIFICPPGSDLKAVAAKLERGSAQTLAYKLSGGSWALLPQPDMDYGTQLAKCQRYLINLDDSSTVSTRNYPGTWIQTAADAGQYVIPLPVVMRAAPGTVTTEGQFYIGGYGNTGAASIPVTLTYAPTASTPNSITMQVAVTGEVLPSPTTCYALSRRDPSSRILVSAEL